MLSFITMKTGRRIWKGIALVIVVFLAFMIWYKIHYSMTVALPFEVNESSRRDHVLVATQGSEFKDALVRQLVDGLRPDSVYIKVMDVSSLPEVNESDWTVIVIIHTWEMGKPPEAVKTFVDRIANRGKLVVMTTSGDGGYKLPGVDGISSASNPDLISGKAEEILKRVRGIMTVH